LGERVATGPVMTKELEVSVSIVMPCLNEAVTLAGCVRNAAEALEIIRSELGLGGEIVVSDNGSTDGSQGIAIGAGARVVAAPRRGYGSALRAGCAAASGRFIVMGDADGSYDFRDAVPMVRKLVEGCELCMGNRFAGRIMPNAMPWKNRYIGNPALTGILNLLFRSRMGDAHCGLRAFTKTAFERMRLTSTGMEFASEIVIKAALLDLRRAEVPITLHPDKLNRPPHLRPWRDGWRHLRYLLMLSPNWLFLAPASIIGAFSLFVFALLVLHPASKMVEVGPFWFGDHWIVLSGAMLAACQQIFIFGLATTLYGIREGYRKPTSFVAGLLASLTLERMMIAGTVLALIGIGLILHVVGVWSTNSGALDRIRELVAGATFAILGLQTFFGGFFMSILNGNEAELVVAARRSAETAAGAAPVRNAPAELRQGR